MIVAELRSILKYLLNNPNIINTETLHNKNGDVKLKLSKRKRNFKILWVLDQFKSNNVAFEKMKKMLMKRQNMVSNTRKGRFVKQSLNFSPITRARKTISPYMHDRMLNS